MKSKLLKIALATALAVPMAAQALVHVFEANLDGLQEVPPVASPGVGVATLVFDDVANTFTLSMGGGGLSAGITLAHIHRAAAGVAGPAIVTLHTQPGFVGLGMTFFALNMDSTPFPVGAGDVNKTAVLAGDTYINVHTSTFPGGEIRGQLMSELIAVPIPEPETYALMLAGLGLVGWVASRRRLYT